MADPYVWGRKLGKVKTLNFERKGIRAETFIIIMTITKKLTKKKLKNKIDENVKYEGGCYVCNGMGL